ncbi:hypothetical protein M0R45_036194 [Rubus argutus]|uniref:Uncharacterized protein n=1 Tax=Rubus argutus TaxID=59490 RepID=A0AAW1VZ01_RUBAR
MLLCPAPHRRRTLAWRRPSHGRKSVSVAAALIHEPELCLSQPADGVDSSPAHRTARTLLLRRFEAPRPRPTISGVDPPPSHRALSLCSEKEGDARKEEKKDLKEINKKKGQSGEETEKSKERTKKMKEEEEIVGEIERKEEEREQRRKRRKTGWAKKRRDRPETEKKKKEMEWAEKKEKEGKGNGPFGLLTF